jgi:ABC-type antimicrobial peptide transport system permease subunit
MSEMTFVLRTKSDPMLAATEAQHIVAAIDNRVPVWKIKTQAAQVQQTIGQERLFAGLSTAFAALALLIASAGLYATMAYGVSRRTNEIGIRMALGAGKGRVVGSVLRESLVTVILGILLGVPAAWTAANLVKAFLFQTRPADAGSLLTALAVLLVSALVAAFLPAWRAASIEPTAALRHE